MRWPAGFLVASALLAQGAVTRPKILGIARVALYVKDLAKSREFYETFLGYAERPVDSGARRIAFVKINDRQYLELFSEPDRGEGQLNHIAIYTDDVNKMRDYLASQGVDVPAKAGRDEFGSRGFDIRDPEGHVVEIVEYRPAREIAKHLPVTRISARIYHAGILVGDLDRSMKFYGDVLGFREFWRGSSSGTALSWVNMRVPDGDDYIEFMLYDKLPAPDKRGTSHHACLLVDDIQQTVEELGKRSGYSREITIRTGVNRKRQVNLFDPDGTRIELMEANTIDGKPAPSSAAPPPRH